MTVAGGNINAYYRPQKAEGQNPVALPPGFQALAGDPTRREYTPGDPAHESITWVCSRDGENISETRGIPEHWRDCNGGIDAEVQLPDCIKVDDDGKPVPTSQALNPPVDDHISHLAYYDKSKDSCPDGFVR